MEEEPSPARRSGSPPPHGEGHGTRSDSGDCISALPDDLLLLILVRLDYHRNAVRTCALSRRWKELWKGLTNRDMVVLRGIKVDEIAPQLLARGAQGRPVHVVDIRILDSEEEDIVFTRQASGEDQVETDRDSGEDQVETDDDSGEDQVAADDDYFEEDEVEASDDSGEDQANFDFDTVVDPYKLYNDPVDSANVSSVLQATSSLSPVELRLVLSPQLARVYLPRFSRATSIELDVRFLDIRLLPNVDYPALERLSLLACNVDDLQTLLTRCPRLRVLRATAMGQVRFIIHSVSLQELHIMTVVDYLDIVEPEMIDIVAPVLKQLTSSIVTQDLSASISAPMLEKLSWKCKYRGLTVGIGFLWRLMGLNLEMAERYGEGTLIDDGEGKCLSLKISACSPYGAKEADHSFEQQIDKLQVAGISTLALHLEAGVAGHIFGPIILHLLGINRICTATRRLKLVLDRSKVKEACPENCTCDMPKDWRTQEQIVSLTNLTELKIEGFEANNDEFDFLKQISRCAPMLTKMTVKLSDEVTPSYGGSEKMYQIIKDTLPWGWYLRSVSEDA